MEQGAPEGLTPHEALTEVIGLFEVPSGIRWAWMGDRWRPIEDVELPDADDD